MNILTFDIEDWFHFLEHPSTREETQWITYPTRIRHSLDRILQFLADRDQKATFFVMGWMAEKYPEIVQSIASGGHDFGLHSYGHQLVWEQTLNSFRTDLQRNISILESLLGRKVTSYRAPGFSIVESTLWALDVMAEMGITEDASIFPTTRAHGGLATFPLNQPCLIDFEGYRIREFPINVASWAGNKFVFSGGGYFRLAPYPLIRHMTKRSDYIMSYFHPRDFDPDQPVLRDLPLIRKFRGYVGLGNSMDKLSRWLNEFSFVDLASATRKVDWGQVPVIRL